MVDRLRIHYLVNDVDQASGNEPPKQYWRTYRIPGTTVTVYYRFPLNYPIHGLERLSRWCSNLLWRCLRKVFYPTNFSMLWSRPEDDE